ncbi:hypothetical protein ANCDUO_16533 [Ancylostoma duodenale]|uniref:Uncharacterized protein n=1 Tax=Ancylostoma duodenale TaxID=51022 RepID=A0A0C2CU69_9BILA|nr:hypothetical protein ANCDUO_16533 [Ancylostoma duodenale]
MRQISSFFRPLIEEWSIALAMLGTMFYCTLAYHCFADLFVSIPFLVLLHACAFASSCFLVVAAGSVCQNSLEPDYETVQVTNGRTTCQKSWSRTCRKVSFKLFVLLFCGLLYFLILFFLYFLAFPLLSHSSSQLLLHASKQSVKQDLGIYRLKQLIRFNLEVIVCLQHGWKPQLFNPKCNAYFTVVLNKKTISWINTACQRA